MSRSETSVSPTPDPEIRQEVRGSRVSFESRPNSHIHFVDDEEVDYFEVLSGEGVRVVNKSGQVRVGHIVENDPIKSARPRFVLPGEPLAIASSSDASSEESSLSRPSVFIESEGGEERSEVCYDSTSDMEWTSLQGGDISYEVDCQLPSSPRPPTGASQQLPEPCWPESHLFLLEQGKWAQVEVVSDGRVIIWDRTRDQFLLADVMNHDPIRGIFVCRLRERAPEVEDKLTTCGYTFTFLSGTASMGDHVCEGTDKGTGKPVNDSSDDGDRWDMLSEAAGASDIGPIASPRERELSTEGLDRSPASDGDKLGEIPSGASSHQVWPQGSPSLDTAEKVESVGSPLGTLEPANNEIQGERQRMWVRSGNDPLWTASSVFTAEPLGSGEGLFEEEPGDVLEPDNADNVRIDSDSAIRPQEDNLEQAQADFFDQFANWAKRVKSTCEDYVAVTQASPEAVQTNQTASLRSNSPLKPHGTGLIFPPRDSASVVGESMADERARTLRPSYLPEGAEALRDRLGDFSESEFDDDVRDKDYYPPKESREVSEEDSCPHPASGTGQRPETVSDPAPSQMRGHSGRVARRRADTSGHASESRCPIPDCTVFTGINIRRHLRSSVHRLTEQQIAEVLARKTAVRGRSVIRCPLLGEPRPDGKICKTKGTKRLDQHLCSWHGILRNSERFTTLMAQAKTQMAALEDMSETQVHFEEVYKRYTSVKEGRSTGKKQRAKTSEGHRSALKIMLPSITPAGIGDLMAAGDRGGRIDTLLKEQKCKARTMQVYLSSIRKFLQWLSSDATELLNCNLKYEQVEQARIRCGLFSRSLNEDVAQEEINETVKESAENEGELLEAWMVVGFADSQVVEDATKIAFQAKDKRLSRTDRVLVRDTLYLALTLDQIRRAGDLNCITVEQAQRAVDQWRRDGCPDTETYQLSAAGAKNYSAGTTNSQTLINVTPTVFGLFRAYLEYVRPQFPNARFSRNFILSERRGEERMSSSAITKAYRRPWDRFAIETGKRLPDLTASMNRSLNVTIQRESGATTEEQKKLATHMTHSHDTASRYYDRSDRVHRVTSLQMTEAMRGLREAAASETVEGSGVCGKSAKSIARAVRKQALLTKPLHGKGASESSSSDDSSDDDDESPKLSAEVIARLTSSSIEEVGRSKGGVPKRSQPPPSPPSGLPKDKESEESEQSEHSEQSDGSGDVERAVCASPLLSQEEEAAQTGQAPVQSLCQREEREALHEIFDQYILRHLRSRETQRRLIKGSVPNIRIDEIWDVLKKGRSKYCSYFLKKFGLTNTLRQSLTYRVKGMVRCITRKHKLVGNMENLRAWLAKNRPNDED